MTTTTRKDNELYITRVYDAPVKAVWDAWTDPKQVAKWWGPRGFTITTRSKDLRAGGHWDYTMHGPDGVDYPNVTQYFEVVKHSKLVYDHGGSHGKPALFRVTVLFSETNGKTKMEMTMSLATAEAAREIRKVIKHHSGESTWDRLAEFLAKESKGKENFVINRTFESPLEIMFDMWTDPKHFTQWLPPIGFTMKFLRPEIKVGSTSFYVMTGANGMMMYGRCEYIEIRRPDRIVYGQQFCDENEKISRHPMAPTWPETMMSTVTLAAEGPTSTRVTVNWEPGPGATAEEIEMFAKARAGMTQGWTGSFDKLEAHIEALK